jgi:hypothetical protein
VEIHRPKIARTWGEFVSEIGIIVCGILIALSLEQFVNWARWHHEAKEAREAFAEELAYDVGALRREVEEDPCIRQRLDLLDAWADGRVQIESTHLYAVNNRPQLWTLRSSAWEVAKAGEVASHMPLRERIAYAAAYDRLVNQQSQTLQERTSWLQLGRYAGKTTLRASEARRLKEDVAEARAWSERRSVNIPTIEHSVRELGVTPATVEYVPGLDAKTLCASPR